MPAKEKLNAANFLGALLDAGLTGSWSVFGFALAALRAATLYLGDIRR